MIDFSDIVTNIGDKIPVIVGPTASGKTTIAIDLAKQVNGEIISVDSRQIYKNFRIGTAQPTEEEKEIIPHHLIDIYDAEKVISAGDYVGMVESKINEIKKFGKRPILVGGTLLYIRSIYEGIIDQTDTNYRIREKIQNRIKSEGIENLLAEMSKIDPEYSKIIHLKDIKRLVRAFEIYELTGKPPTIVFQEQKINDSKKRSRFSIIQIQRSRVELNKRIELRVDEMIDTGWLEEVETLMKTGTKLQSHAMQSVGYYQLSQVVEGFLTLDEAVVIIKQKTRQFAKRQLTWLRKMNVDYKLDLSELS